MPPPRRTSLRSFLAAARKVLAAPASQRPSPLTFVVGNESADLDSLCCALVFAYLRTHSPPHYALHIPLAHMARDELAVHTELKPVLAAAGLRASDLLTLSDLPGPVNGEDALDPASTRWLLVDHNALTGDLGQRFGPHVVGCVDHHADEGKIPNPPSEDHPRVVRKSGSCMSLVIEQCRDAWEALSQRSGGGDGDSARWDAELARLALAPMLIDTTNLKSQAKTTEVDVQGVQFAERMLAADPGYDRTAYFDKITRVKEDISGLSYRDILRKDYKQWADGGLTLGVSSIVQGLDYLLDKIGDETALLQALRDWAAERRLDIVGIMTTSHVQGEFKRELLLWALNDRGIKATRVFFERNKESLGLETWEGGRLDTDTNGEGGSWRACWWQRRTEYSRKKIAPSLREAMESASKL